MMDMEEREGMPVDYYIPQNFEDAGGMFGGRFTQRNGIEMAIVGAPLAWINMNLIFPYVSLQTGIIIFLLTVLPPVFLCAIGLGGESASQFLIAFARFLRRRRFLSFVVFCGEKKSKKGIDLRSVLNSFHNAKDEEDWEEDDYESEPIAEATIADVGHMAESVIDAEQHASQKSKQKAKAPKQNKPESHMHIMNSAMKEILLRKFELTDDDDTDS